MMTSKTHFASAFAALFLSALFVGSAVIPGTVIAAVPVVVVQDA